MRYTTPLTLSSFMCRLLPDAWPLPGPEVSCRWLRPAAAPLSLLLGWAGLGSPERRQMLAARPA